jgi:hypothetical protein
VRECGCSQILRSDRSGKILALALAEQAAHPRQPSVLKPLSPAASAQPVAGLVEAGHSGVADRQFLALLRQHPPRRTRPDPDPGPAEAADQEAVDSRQHVRFVADRRSLLFGLHAVEVSGGKLANRVAYG